ncbi:hypothetical protein KQX54_012254 [Cotesia glomerata]|uniref:Uncharacterized protein n=1 Tax=Cotesia glomerata TaxID=32391 RepID=A0AAV7I911_COTGL|nr:hypothetical protein KQX54_012254 [Cotesia glomerata]
MISLSHKEKVSTDLLAIQGQSSTKFGPSLARIYVLENSITPQFSLDATINQPKVTQVQILNPPLKLFPIPDDRQSQAIQTNAEDSLPPRQIPSIIDMSLLTASFNQDKLSQPAKDAVAITDFINRLSQRVDQIDGKLEHVSQALIVLSTTPVTTNNLQAAVETVCKKIEAYDQNIRDRVTMIDNRVVQMETQHNQLRDSVQTLDSQATAVRELELQVHDLRDEVVNGNETNSAMKHEIGKIGSVTTELGKMLTGAQIAVRTTLNYTSRIAKAVASVPEIRERLWTDEESKNWSQLDPKLLSSTPPSDNLKNMSANEERLFQLIQEILRISLRVPVSGATRTDTQPAQNQTTGLDDSPVHYSSRVNQTGSILNNSTEDQLTEIWQELARLGTKNQSQIPSKRAGDNARNNTSGNRPCDREDLIVLKKLARARNLGFLEEEAQPKIYLQELQEFKAEQQILDKNALSLVKTLFAKTHAQWLRLNSHRWTTWEDFVNANDQSMKSLPSEKIQVNIIAQRLTKQLQVELKTSPTTFTEYIGFRLAVNIAMTNLQYLSKAYDENEKFFVKKKSHTQPPAQVRVIQSPEIIQLDDEGAINDTEIDLSINYVKNNYSQRRGNFTRNQGSDSRRNKNSGRRVNYAADVRNSDSNRSPKDRIPPESPNHCEYNPETRSFTSNLT